jgi:Holliday junction resolvase RusA-like endonuclease
VVTGEPLLVLDAFVPGAPKSKGSLTARGDQMVENVVGSKQWRMLMANRLRRYWGGIAPLAGPVQVDAYFYLPVASNRALIAKGARGNYDKDKLERNLYDALTDAGVWKDDSQAVDGRIAKVMATASGGLLPQGVRVLVWDLLSLWGVG